MFEIVGQPSVGGFPYMIERIAYLRAERANIDRLIEEYREVVLPEIDEGATAHDPMAALTRKADLLDYAIAEWDAAAKRVP